MQLIGFAQVSHLAAQEVDNTGLVLFGFLLDSLFNQKAGDVLHLRLAVNLRLLLELPSLNIRVKSSGLLADAQAYFLRQNVASFC